MAMEEKSSDGQGTGQGSKRRRPHRGPGRGLMDGLSSYGFSCIILICLLGLTLKGTLDQESIGLYACQVKYFDSYYWMQRIGPLAFPLPGAYLLLGLLLVNLVCGGIIRIKYRWRTIGIIVGHWAMVLMLIAGLVKFHYSDEGHLQLDEGQSDNQFISYHDWEIAIGEHLPGGQVREYLIPDRQFARLRPTDRATFSSPELPFDLVLSGFLSNCVPTPQRPGQQTLEPMVEGFYLQERLPAKEAEQNIPGLYVTVLEKNVARSQPGILWGNKEGHPMAAKVGERVFTLDLRHVSFPLPFTIRLEDFEKRDHPGISSPASFSSEVSKIEGGEVTRHTISMNEPLRHRGFILFQSGWGPPNARPGQPLYSIFAVARNPSDHWPLISCVIMTLGMLFHFSLKLFAFARAQMRRQA